MKNELIENLNIYVFTTKFVIKENSPILYVSHDENGDWQFLGVENNLKEEDAMVVSFGEILEHDPTLFSTLKLPIGKIARRNVIDEKWIIS